MADSVSETPGIDAAFLRQMLDSLPAPIYAKDENAKFVYSNSKHDELVGRPAAELIGKSDADFYPAETAEAFLRADLSVIEGGETIAVEEWANADDGMTRPVLSLKARMIGPDGRHYLLGTNSDLTEIKKREEQYRALAETVPVAVIQFEEDGSASFANPLFLALFGHDDVASNVGDFTAAVGHPQNFPGHASRFECSLKGRNNQDRHVLVISSGWLFLTKGKNRSAIVSVVDITENAELKRINDEILRLNKELASNVSQLREAQDALVKKGRLEQMGQLTATIAHELRNPLGAVRTSVFLIERKLKDKGLGIDTQLQRINNGIIRCDAIITQLLDFSRTKKITAEAGDLDQWLARIVEEEAKRLASCITVSCTLGLGDLLVPFDPSRLHRAISNMLSNAAEAMVGIGDVPLLGTSGAPTIHIGTRIENDMVAIAVADNGPGISVEALDKIREPLFTTKSFGTGLGVPAIEQIAFQHGGSLSIESTPGKGAVFTLRLPIVSVAKGEAA